MIATQELAAPKSEAARPYFRPDIEGLRGIAILLVVIFHIGAPILRGGFIGVDVFFTLSGYLISGLILREFEQTGRLNFINFYARRVRRLLPAATLVLLATLLLAQFFYSPLELSQLAAVVQSAALYYSNLYFAQTASIYANAQAGGVNALQHTWSLGVEEQFYLLWPLLLVGCLWVGARTIGPRKVATLVMVLVSVVSFALCCKYTLDAQYIAFFVSPLRFWEFGVGSLVALLPLQSNPKAGRFSWLAIPALLLIFVAAYQLQTNSVFPGPWAVAPVGATAWLLLSGAIWPTGRVTILLSHPVLLWIGQRSYSWYLWHWPLVVFALAAWTARLEGILASTAASALALGCAAVTFKLFEQPIRLSRFLHARPLVTLAMGLILLACGVTGANISIQRSAALAALTQQKPIFDAKITALGDCLIKTDEVQPYAKCVYGDLNSPVNVVLFGDSHASQWQPGLQQVALQKHWRLTVIAKGGCPVAVVPNFVLNTQRSPFTACAAFQQIALSQISAMRPTLVIESSLSSYAPNYNADGVQAFVNGIRQILGPLDQAGIAQVMIADTPSARFDVPTCLSRAAAGLTNEADCEFSRPTNADSIRDAEQSLMASFSHGHFIDFNDQLCPNGRCSVERAGVVMYFDNSHLATAFSAAFAPELAAKLDSVLK